MAQLPLDANHNAVISTEHGDYPALQGMKITVWWPDGSFAAGMVVLQAGKWVFDDTGCWHNLDRAQTIEIVDTPAQG